METPTPTQLGDAIRTLWERGQAAWPELQIPLELFEHHVASWGNADATTVAALHAEDLFLACACLQRMPGAVAAFELAFGAALTAAARKAEPTSERMGELRQILLCKLFLPAPDAARPKIAEYSGRGPLLAWVRMALTRTALNLRRDEGRMLLQSQPDLEAKSAAPDVELSFIRGLYEPEIRVALRAALAALPENHRFLLKLSHRDALTSAELGAVLNTSRTVAHRRLTAAREALEQEFRKQLGSRLEVGGEALESLLRLVETTLMATLAADVRAGLLEVPAGK